MSQSSTFLTQEPVVGPINCRPTPDVALYYDGTTTAVPTLSATGMITFTGAVTNRPNGGIGATGPGNVFLLPFASILGGGAGVKQRCVVAATKQKLRLYVAAGNSSIDTTNLGFRLRVIQTCGNPYEYDMENPIYVYYRPSIVDTVAQKLAAFVARFNTQYAHLGTATVGGGNTYVDIETLNVGERFSIEVASGFTDVKLITPGFKGAYDPAIVADWFPGNTNPSSVNAIELFITQNFPSGIAGSATSNPNQDAQGIMTVNQTVTIVFAANTNGNAALSALKTILRGPASGNLAQPYIAKMVGDDCADVVQYPYTITRTDAGNDAALATLRSDYSAALSGVRLGYAGGVSTYAITTASGTAPSAVSGDTVTVGASYPSLK